MTFDTIKDMPVTELREGDWPVSIAGFRPVQRIRTFPRKRQVAVWIDGTRYNFPAGHTVGRVRRPRDTEAPPQLQSFDPFSALRVG